MTCVLQEGSIFDSKGKTRLELPALRQEVGRLSPQSLCFVVLRKLGCCNGAGPRAVGQAPAGPAHGELLAGAMQRAVAAASSVSFIARIRTQGCHEGSSQPQLPEQDLTRTFHAFEVRERAHVDWVLRHSPKTLRSFGC